jgi:hypothetical protein
MNGDFIGLGEALKLVPYFKGDKQEVLAFIGNVDRAFAVIIRCRRMCCLSLF